MKKFYPKDQIKIIDVSVIEEPFRSIEPARFKTREINSMDTC